MENDNTQKQITCPNCSTQMQQGWLVLWNPLIFTKVRWQPIKSGYVRFKVPSGSNVVLQAKAGGRDPRIAFHCPNCSSVVIPPDPVYS